MMVIMKDAITQLKKTALEAIDAVDTLEGLEKLRILYFGKKSPFNDILKSLKDLSPEQKRDIGPLANTAKGEVQKAFDTKKGVLEARFDAESEWIDVTAPGDKKASGHLSPLTIVQRDIEEIFTGMGFEIADGPEVETEFYNFDAVNVPADHPARDMQDTFWAQNAKAEDATEQEREQFVLRTHTSSVQVRYMESHTPPYRIIIPGRVFRQEATDASHEHTFHQFEALVVGDDISVANFLSVAETFFSQFFGKKLKVRLRPSYFPFVEPGFEFDISCTNCAGKGCSTCQQIGWLEVGGAGMVHQNVLVAAGYEKDQYTGFAWGFGMERLAMMKYKIDDIRHFQSGDLRFTKQF